MTEEEWLTSTNAEALLIGLDKLQYDTSRASAFYATFTEADRLRQLLTPQMRVAFDVFVRWVQEYGSHPATLWPEFAEFDPLKRQRISTWEANESIESLIISEPAHWFRIDLLWLEACNQPLVYHRYRWRESNSSTTDWLRRQAERLRNVVGNPFRPVTFSPEWRTDTTVALARQMYASRDFSAMPILADALQEAGCDNADVLNHCRDAGATHVRGCWVVDMVLGKS